MASPTVSYESNTEITLTEYSISETNFSDSESSNEDCMSSDSEPSMEYIIDWMNDVVRNEVQKLQQLTPAERVHVIPSLREKIKWLTVNDTRYEDIGYDILLMLDRLKNVSQLLIEE